MKEEEWPTKATLKTKVIKVNAGAHETDERSEDRRRKDIVSCDGLDEANAY